MYAIIKIGHGQLKVNEGDILMVNNLNLDEGKDITIKEVLLTKDGKRLAVGTPFVEGASVACKVMPSLRGKKVIAFKFKKRKHEKRKVGFRSELSTLKVEKINIGS